MGEMPQQKIDERVDVLVVGAGLAGIGAAWRLSRERPGSTVRVLEARGAVGGTWDLFRFPGVRSDSDMATLSYPFRPWTGPAVTATGSSIRRYIARVAEEDDLLPLVRFHTTVVSAGWSSVAGRWSVDTTVRDPGTGATTPRRYSCAFLYACTGYFDHDRGHQPRFAGMDDFRGRFVHPQFWPADLDHAGRRVVVIGSGATAVTLVPALAETAAQVTMLQRSPSYVTALPATDGLAAALLRVLPSGPAHTLNRAKNVLLTQAFYELARRRPERVKRILRGLTLRFLPDPGYVDEHFTPRYEPWDQRVSVAPDGDLFRAIRAGRAAVITDHIDRFVENGIRLRSGTLLEADVVVSATGLELRPIGGIALSVDGRPIDLADTIAYRGVMLSGVPNFAYCIGYTNASWTLRADLSTRFVCRLLDRLERRGHAAATPSPPPGTERRPLLGLTSGYVQRAIHRFPRQGGRHPWRTVQNYPLDRLRTLRLYPWRDLRFS
jgi:monooxygenase